MEANAVFSGGGVKGIAFVGAIQVCEDLGYRWRQLAGSSSGSIVAALLAAGYSATEIYEILKTINYKKIIEPTIWDRLPFGRFWRMFMKKGLYSGAYIEKWMDQHLAKRNICTFADLPSDKLSIIASDLTTGKILHFPHDAALFKQDPQKLKISTAIRMSIGIPFFFDPVIWKNDQEHYIVDGGVLSNFPVWLFDEDTLPKYPTFGFNLRSYNHETVHTITGPLTMLYALISVMIDYQDMKYIEKQDAVRTIFIPTHGIKATDFSIAEEEQDILYNAGKEAAKEFFKNWDFEEYLSFLRKLKIEVAYKKEFTRISYKSARRDI